MKKTTFTAYSAGALIALVAWGSLSQAQSTISINFSVNGNGTAADAPLAPTDVAGAVPKANWNDANPDAGGPLALVNDAGVDSGASVTWDANGAWGGTADRAPIDPDERMMTTWMDNNGNFTFTGIPYNAYDVYVYGTSDSEGNAGQGNSVLVNDLAYGTVGVFANPGSPNGDYFFGHVDGATGADNPSYIRVPGVSGPTLTVDGNNAAAGFRGALSGIQIVEVNFEGTIRLNVNRDSGSISLTNNTGSSINMAGLSLLSDVGALDSGNWTSITDNYDKNPPGDESVSGDEWNVFLGASNELSEGTLGTGTVAQGQTVDLGTPWIKNPAEDVTVEYLDANTGDTIPGNVVFIGDGPFAAGDYNNDGAIDQLDWPTQRDNYEADLSGLSQAEAYQFGDFDFDGDNDVADQLAFKAAFLVANPGASLASVPEPTSLLLLAIACVLFGGRRLTRASLKAAPLMLMLVVVFSLTAVEANAASIGFNFGRTDAHLAPDEVAGVVGQANWTNTDATAGTVNNLVNNTGTATTADVTWDANEIWSFGTPDTTQGKLVAGWTSSNDPGEADSVTISQIPYDKYDLYIYVGHDRSPGRTVFTETGGAFADFLTLENVTNATLDTVPFVYTEIPASGDSGNYIRFPELTQDSLNIQFSHPTDNQLLFSAFQIVDFQAITLRIDPDSGYSEIKNGTDGPVTFDFYEVSSDPSASLTFSTWNSLQDQDYEGNGAPGTGNGWEELGDPGELGDNRLAEFYLDNSSTLEADGSIPLGKIFNTSTGVQDDIGFRYNDVNGITQGGFIEFGFVEPPVPALTGDYNGNGQVEQSDLDLVLLNWGDTTPPIPDGWINDEPVGQIDQAELDKVLLNWGDTAPMAQAVPEPSGSVMLLLTALTASGLWSSRRRKQARKDGESVMHGVERIRIAAVTLVGICLLGSSALMAAVTNDREYWFGEDALEGASQGATIGSNNSGGVPADTTVDSEGPTGAFLDLTQSGGPTYQQVGPSGLGRPGVTGSEFGARFDGTDDRLNGISLNRPDEMAGPTPVGEGPLVAGYPFNYDSITVRGLQAWVYPDQAGIAAGNYQNIVFDTIFSGGPAINEQGQWTQTNSFHPSEGVGQVPATESVTGDTWYHVMHHNYDAADPTGPQLVPNTGGGRPFTSVLFVDGIAVSANNDNINVGGDAAFTGALLVGAGETDGDGSSGEYVGYFDGVIDDLEMYVYGNNSSEGGQDYGTFDLFVDNEWIANTIADTVPGGVLTPGDVNKDGAVNGDGTGPVGSDDVSAFIAGWRSTNIIEGVHNSQTVGDWLTWDNGDLDHNGTTNFSDWYLLRANHPTPASLNLAALLSGAAVPEPSSAGLALLGALAWFGWGRRR